MTRPERGHRELPHTADIRIQAWGPTQESCLSEAVAALVATFADVSGAREQRCVEFDLGADTEEEALLGTLDEVIYLLDTQDVVPLGADVERGAARLRVRMPVARVQDVDIVGAAPKAVALHGLRFSHETGAWRCAVTIDV
ncbi:archease [Kutzneria sp. 744]|uniref:archease n=1 Tax=Kutzneria sp. (strain 744) TaxID=345341 RepID=UPI0003EEBAA3|nr:archease [Kutzneria sp. 744]EWM19133.1 hypothetical protein KUTG_09437 [Kutzneria sp. 744]